ncbi:EamA-like transporter family protein [Roseovarius albus]|uniref:EamA-like transporter family protein n=1 Tax=Roseovarius albus TaxID=1247867 RepID=A0A1X6Z203_9RHOB|nr:DMT family transporter [Roseovarius albus]SLN37640.1 EamA-like transporter family protein [Roseovarius albus]
MSSENTSQPRADNIPLAVTAIVLAVLALPLGDALIKGANTGFAISQIFILRSALVVPVFVAIIMMRNPKALRLPKRLGWATLRGFFMTIMWVFYYLSLPHLELSAAAAAYYTCPIFITLFSAMLLGNKIKAVGWIAVIVGFLGVLLILRPKADDFNWYALFPIVSAVLYALAMIATRAKMRDEHPLILAMSLHVSFIITGAAIMALGVVWPSDATQGSSLFASWGVMGTTQWGVMAILGVALLIGSIGAVVGYQNGPPSLVGTFDFAYVGFAVMWGILLLGETPDPVSIVGMLMITGAGIMAMRQ